jgi:hypothetical protein
MAEPPAFFFSYARQDRETPGKYLLRFFGDLEAKVAQFLGVDQNEKPLGVIDSRVQQGDDWDADLCDGLQHANAFVAILTPVYFRRPNCGKELAAFLLRSPGLATDPSGSLMGARNLMLIRWLPDYAYAANTVRDSLIPLLLRRIEDAPADDGRDPDRTRAIEKYRRSGMETCVGKGHYTTLLNLFAWRIREWPSLDAGPEVSFSTARDAFTYDWLAGTRPGGGGQRSAAPLAAAPAAAPVALRALTSIVAFYVTHRPVAADPVRVDFADRLLAETPPGGPGPADPEMAALLADVRMAGVAEGCSVFHAAGYPPIPAESGPLLARLARLSAMGVMTVLIVDPAVWTPGAVGPQAAAIEDLVHSPDWIGEVLLPLFDGASVGSQLPERVLALPLSSEARVALLRRCFVSIRGRALSNSSGQAANAERLPMLKGTRGQGP